MWESNWQKERKEHKNNLECSTVLNHFKNLFLTFISSVGKKESNFHLTTLGHAFNMHVNMVLHRVRWSQYTILLEAVDTSFWIKINNLLSELSYKSAP